MEENEMVWYCQYKVKTNYTGKTKTIRVGYRQENNKRGLWFAYFDFDTVNSERVANSEKEIIQEIEKSWGSGDFDSYKLIKQK